MESLLLIRISNRLYKDATNSYITNIASTQSYSIMAEWTQVVNDIVVPVGFTAGLYKFQINWSSTGAANLSNFYIDDIKVQLMQANRPQVSTVNTVGVASTISTTSFVANWTPSTDINVDGYDVNVY